MHGVAGLSRFALTLMAVLSIIGAVHAQPAPQCVDDTATLTAEARFGPLLDRLRTRTEKPVRLAAATISITPQWRYEDSDRTLIGFMATRTLRLTDVPVDRAGAWLQTLTDAEADSLSPRNYTAQPEDGTDARPALAANDSGEAAREPAIEPDTVIDHARVTVVFALEHRE